MSASFSAAPAAPHLPAAPLAPHRLAVGRAVLALLWAAALILAVGDRVPTPATDVPAGVALLLATYPLIDVVASLLAAPDAAGSRRVLRVNAVAGVLAAAALAVAGLTADAGAVLVVFGVWAAASGLAQLALALRGASSRWPLVLSGGLSTLAGLSFVVAAGADDTHLATLAGYMALGAVLFLASARRRPA